MARRFIPKRIKEKHKHHIRKRRERRIYKPKRECKPKDPMIFEQMMETTDG